MRPLRAALALLLLLLAATTMSVWAEQEEEDFGSIIPLKLDSEITNQHILAPGHVSFLLTSEGILPYESVEIRISYLSLPPVRFSFEVFSLPGNHSRLFLPGTSGGSASAIKRKQQQRGSGVIRGKRRRRQLREEQQQLESRRRRRRRRRRLDTEILTLPMGKAGMLLDGTRLPAVVRVSAKPAGVTPKHGMDRQVLARFNIVAERKVLNNLLPYSAWKMIMVGAICFLVSAFVYVRLLFKMLSQGDTFVSASMSNNNNNNNNGASSSSSSAAADKRM